MSWHSFLENISSKQPYRKKERLQRIMLFRFYTAVEPRLPVAVLITLILRVDFVHIYINILCFSIQANITFILKLVFSRFELISCIFG